MFKFVGIILFICIMSLRAQAQISPGELTSAHASLEGVDHCTRCHSIGKAIADDKCLDCHTEIASRIGRRTGYHASIGAKHCFDCHKEHHGRGFEIIRFDTKSFDHASVGFRLEGAHAKLACARCHRKEHIAADDVHRLSDARKQSTMLGLSQACSSCHQDAHRGQFTAQCGTCHTPDRWKPAANFSHARARFQLTGKHEKIQCEKCHNKTLGDGRTVQYAKMEFASCRACHADPHKGRFAQACAHCHTTDDFHRVKQALFDHAATRFPLKGMHAGLKCERCHANDPARKNIAGETGFHITRYGACSDCHADAHAKQFDARTDKGRCDACHTENGFAPSTYTSADHARSHFALTGAHLAIPCAKCHEAGMTAGKSTRRFRWNGGIACTTCHRDTHAGQFAARMTSKGCETCHTTDAWQSLTFSHTDTKFPLRGRHAETGCPKCHKAEAGTGGVVRYAGTAMQCGSCHGDEHAGQFADGGETDCTRCHTEAGWKAVRFSHDTQSRFRLEGKHAALACAKCHRTEAFAGRMAVRYKPLGTACIDCHAATSK